MYKKFILALVTIIFSSVAANAGGVTNIKEIINETNFVVEVKKYGTDGEELRLEQTSENIRFNGTWSGDIWIPWVDNATDFYSKRLEIVVNRRTAFWIWQSGEYVRYNARAQFVANAQRVPGEAKAGGERRLIISVNNDNQVVFKFDDLRNNYVPPVGETPPVAVPVYKTPPVVAVPVGKTPPVSDVPAAITVAKQTEMESLARNYNLGNRRADSAGGAKTSQSGYDGTRGWWLCYEKGCVYYSTKTGVHTVSERIFQKWIQVGYENGTFGYPTTDELPCGGSGDVRDRYQRFQGGVLYFRASTNFVVAYTGGTSGEDHKEFPCK